MSNESFYAVVCSLGLFAMVVLGWTPGGPEHPNRVKVTGEENRILTIGGDANQNEPLNADVWQLEIIDIETGDVTIVDYNLTLGDCIVQSKALHDQGFTHVGCMRVGRWH